MKDNHNLKNNPSKTKKVDNKELEEMKKKYLMCLADYQNLEKKIIVERNKAVEEGQGKVLLNLLDFFDHLEKAESFVKDSSLKMIKNNLFKSLSKLGLKQINILGKPFNPYFAEAIEIVPGEKKDNLVVGIIRKGYLFKDKVLRVARVKVSKKG